MTRGPGGDERPRTAAALGVIALAASIPYFTALGNEFLTWDDNIIILGQPFLRELSLQNLWTILSPVPAREEWLPLRDLTLLLNFTLLGDNPSWFAAGNILLHAGTSCALWFLFLRLGASRYAALLGALVFAAHAVHVESVTWLSGRKDPLSGLFLILALTAHARYRAGQGRHGTVVALLLLALLSKASAFVFPLWAAAYDLFYRRDLGPRARFLSIVPYAVLAGTHILLFLKLIAADGVVEDYPAGGLASVLLTNGVLLRDYALHVILPLRHQAIYEVAFLASPWNLEFLASVALLVGITAAAWRLRRTPWVPFACVLFFSSLLPYLNIVPHGIYYAERYLYLPSIAFALACGILGTGILEALGTRRAARLSAAGVMAVLLCVHALLASTRSLAWADSETFWKHQAQALPRNPAPLMNLGETRELVGDDARAARTYGTVLERFGVVPEAYYRLARIARRRGELETALHLYEKACALLPADPRPLNNLAEVHLARGDLERAIHAYRTAVERHPRYLLARANLARALEQAGRAGEAAEHWRHVAASADLLPQRALAEEARARLGRSGRSNSDPTAFSR